MQITRDKVTESVCKPEVLVGKLLVLILLSSSTRLPAFLDYEITD
jgi:hypothetical protein